MRARYVGHGEHYEAIPARDLNDDDWERLTEDQRAVVERSPLYELASRRRATARPDETEVT